MNVNIEVEYCGSCGYAIKFEELKQILEKQSHANIKGIEGRRGPRTINYSSWISAAILQHASFEVKVNDTLIHSKLSTMAFPDFNDVSNIVTEVASGQEIRKYCKQQPITNCILM